MPCSRQYNYINTMSVCFLGRQPHIRPCTHLRTPSLAHCEGKRTSQQLLAIWHPAWPTKRVNCQPMFIFAQCCPFTPPHHALDRPRGKQTVERDDFTHGGCVCSRSVLCGLEWCRVRWWRVVREWWWAVRMCFSGLRCFDLVGAAATIVYSWQKRARCSR